MENGFYKLCGFEKQARNREINILMIQILINTYNMFPSRLG